MTTTAMTYADFYGRTHLGAISSIDITMHLLGTAAGPVIATRLRRMLGSYSAVFLVYTILPLVTGTVVLCCARKPSPPLRTGDDTLNSRPRGIATR